MNILFVCRANVGRSQMAEVIFNSLANGKHHATSAGTQVLENAGQKLKDRPGAANTLAVLKEMGIDASENERTQLTEQMVEETDKIVNMAEPESVPEYLLNSDKTVVWKFEDPKDRSEEFTRNVRDQIVVKVKELIAELE